MLLVTGSRFRDRVRQDVEPEAYRNVLAAVSRRSFPEGAIGVGE